MKNKSLIIGAIVLSLVVLLATVTSDVTIYIENPTSAMTLGSNWSGFNNPTVVFDYKNVTSE
ncbi:MAG: hypothetical protein J6B98_05420 [Bacilli bacterium]|nr:hypothetical protein [Bacilli bacterium]